MQHLSKFLSLILRHKPETIGIKLDPQGWADVTELVKGMRNQGKKVDITDLDTIVDEDTKGRYSYNSDKSKIRANQGHSIKVDLGLVEETPPSWLYHGTNSRFVDAIMKEGLKPMGRHHVHLSEEIETAQNVGDRRKKSDTETKIFKISTIEMTNDGHKFYKSENGVWLTDTVPSIYLR